MKPIKLKSKVLLPSREAVDALTKGGPQAMSLGNYAKYTPSGANATMTYDGIMNMAKKGASAKPR